jgi:hypothetical protein
MNDGNVVYDNIGSINYATGELTINSMQILGYIGSVNDVRISIEQQEEDDDVRPIYNEILLLDDSTTDSVAALSNGITINTIGINT